MSEVLMPNRVAAPSAKMRIAHEPYVVLQELMQLVPSLHAAAIRRGTSDWMPARREDRIILGKRLPPAEELSEMAGMVSDALEDMADGRQISEVLGHYLVLFNHHRRSQDPYFLDAFLLQLEIEVRLNPFSIQALSGAMRELCAKHTFFPSVAEIIVSVRDMKARFTGGHSQLLKLLDLRRRIDAEHIVDTVAEEANEPK